MVSAPAHDHRRAVELFKEHNTAQLMRESHRAERKDATRARSHGIGEPVRAAENEGDGAPDVTQTLQLIGKRARRHPLPRFIEDPDVPLSVFQCFEEPLRLILLLCRFVFLLARRQLLHRQTQERLQAPHVLLRPGGDPGRLEGTDTEEGDTLHKTYNILNNIMMEKIISNIPPQVLYQSFLPISTDSSANSSTFLLVEIL